MIVEFEPGNIENCLLNNSTLTISSDTAMVLITGPSKAIILTPPLPTTPKFAAVPRAISPGVWGDHLTEVKEVGSLMPNWRIGFYIFGYDEMIDLQTIIV